MNPAEAYDQALIDQSQKLTDQLREEIAYLNRRNAALVATDRNLRQSIRLLVNSHVQRVTL